MTWSRVVIHTIRPQSTRTTSATCRVEPVAGSTASTPSIAFSFPFSLLGMLACSDDTCSICTYGATLRT